MAPGKLHGNATMAYGMRGGRRNEDKKKVRILNDYKKVYYFFYHSEITTNTKHLGLTWRRRTSLSQEIRTIIPLSKSVINRDIPLLRNKTVNMVD